MQSRRLKSVRGLAWNYPQSFWTAIFNNVASASWRFPLNWGVTLRPGVRWGLIEAMLMLTAALQLSCVGESSDSHVLLQVRWVDRPTQDTSTGFLKPAASPLAIVLLSVEISICMDVWHQTSARNLQRLHYSWIWSHSVGKHQFIGLQTRERPPL